MFKDIVCFLLLQLLKIKYLKYKKVCLKTERKFVVAVLLFFFKSINV